MALHGQAPMTSNEFSPESHFARSGQTVARRKWLWLLGACLSLLLTAGCQQFVILSYLIGGPPSIEPDFNKETGLSLKGKENTVAVVCFAPREMLLEFPNIDDEIAAQVAFRLGENKITIVKPDYVRAWIDAHPKWELAEEIGREFKANYVVEVELSTFSLYEGTSTTLFRGRTEADVHVTEVDDSGHGDRIFSKELDFHFPVRVPRSSTEGELLPFKREYISRLSDKIGWMFYESYNGDTIPWAN
jgi:hypothetical protein